MEAWTDGESRQWEGAHDLVRREGVLGHGAGSASMVSWRMRMIATRQCDYERARDREQDLKVRAHCSP